MQKNKQPTHAYWDAENYDRYNRLQTEFALKILNKYNFMGNESVLDVGSGTGNITAEIAKRVPQGKVIGIDSSKNMVEFAQQHFQNNDNLSFIYAKAEEFSFNEKFDVITSFTVFHWIAQQEKALENCFNHLKPKGLFFLGLSVPTFVNNIIEQCCNSIIEQKWSKQFQKYEPSFYLSDYTMHDYKKILRRVGFKIITFDYVIMPFAFNDHQDLANWFFAWMPHRRVLNDEEAKIFFLDLAKEYTRMTRNFSNENVYYEYCAWDILLQK